MAFLFITNFQRSCFNLLRPNPLFVDGDLFVLLMSRFGNREMNLLKHVINDQADGSSEHFIEPIFYKHSYFWLMKKFMQG